MYGPSTGHASTCLNETKSSNVDRCAACSGHGVTLRLEGGLDVFNVFTSACMAAADIDSLCSCFLISHVHNNVPDFCCSRLILESRLFAFAPEEESGNEGGF
jgi:hypothetical protein